MSRRLPWYKRDVDAWRGGTRGMSLELRGFYSECLDAMWDLQGCIPREPEKLALMFCCNPRTIRKLLPQLVGLGKLVLTSSGYINPRMQGEIEAASSSGIRGQFDRNSKPIRPEFDPKIPKNSMNSTRDLEEEKEKEEEGGGACARDEIQIDQGKVKIGAGVAEDLATDFPGVDLEAVAIRAAVELTRHEKTTRAHRQAVVRRCALFETQMSKPKRSAPTGQTRILEIIRGNA